jgi:predicted RNA-binding Zn-ribbon protein involved in translation (DUF1610 family)
MNTTDWWILGTGIAIIIGLPSMGFAAMSTNTNFKVPTWLPKIFFLVAIAVFPLEGWYFWHHDIYAKIVTIIGALAWIIYLVWPLLNRNKTNINTTKSVETPVVNVSQRESLPGILTDMHRRLVELQAEKFTTTNISYKQFEKEMRFLADIMGTVNYNDWPKFEKEVENNIRKAIPRRPFPRLDLNFRRSFFEFNKWREEVYAVALSVASETKMRLFKYKEWTFEDSVKISDWMDDRHWGVREIRDKDPVWKNYFDSIGGYLKDDILGDLIYKHIEYSRFYNNSCLIALYSQRFPKTSFSIMLQESLIGSPISTVQAEIALNDLFTKILNLQNTGTKPTTLYISDVLTNAHAHQCSKCGWGVKVNMFDSVAICPKCGNVDNVRLES